MSELEIVAPIGELAQDLEPHDRDTARRIVNQVNQDLRSAVVGMIELWQHRDWEPLGYSSWQELCTSEFPFQVHFPKAERVEAVGQLTEAGMSTRDAAAALGVGKSTIERDRQELSRNGTVETTGADGKVREYPAPKSITEIIAGASQPQSDDQELTPAEERAVTKAAKSRQMVLHEMQQKLVTLDDERSKLLSVISNANRLGKIIQLVDDLEALKSGEHGAEAWKTATDKAKIKEYKELVQLINWCDRWGSG